MSGLGCASPDSHRSVQAHLVTKVLCPYFKIQVFLYEIPGICFPCMCRESEVLLILRGLNCPVRQYIGIFCSMTFSSNIYIDRPDPDKLQFILTHRDLLL